jgi:hypothetical protein
MIEFAIDSHLLSYDEAWLYCATLTYNNKYDWRIPTYDECSMYNIDSHWFHLPYETFVHGTYITPVRDVC